MEYEAGDTVYALRVLGRDACCEAPSMLFAIASFMLMSCLVTSDLLY